MFIGLNLLCFGALLRDNLLRSDFCLCTVIYLINLLACAHSRLATELPCLCLALKTASLSLGTSFLLSHFVCMRRNLTFNIAPGTTSVKNTHQTLTTIPF